MEEIYKYINYRCRKCNKYISIEKRYSKYHNSNYFRNMLFSKQYHNCPEGIADDERVVCDCISMSNTPLSEAYEIVDRDHNIIINKEN